MNEFKSRFGYHSCDYETYLKLKKLYKHFWQSVYDHARWSRWNRKESQNRVIRRRLAKGQPLIVIGPWTEPEYCYPLLRADIAEAFQNARKPSLTPEEVRPLTLSLHEIDSLLGILDCWISKPAA